MKIIDSPNPSNGVKLHLLSGNRIGVSHTGSGLAHDADPNNGGTDPNAAQPPDDISKLMQFLADKLQPQDLTEAQSMIEQIIAGSSTSGGAMPVAIGQDAKARQRAQANKSFSDRWGPNATRMRTV